jgi:hypothetical protein
MNLRETIHELNETGRELYPLSVCVISVLNLGVLLPEG